jgi:hypothetical protein
MELSLQNVLLIGSVSENLSHATGLASVVQRLLNYSVFSFPVSLFTGYLLRCLLYCDRGLRPAG